MERMMNAGVGHTTPKKMASWKELIRKDLMKAIAEVFTENLVEFVKDESRVKLNIVSTPLDPKASAPQTEPEKKSFLIKLPNLDDVKDVARDPEMEELLRFEE